LIEPGRRVFERTNVFATIVVVSPRRVPVSRRDRPAKAPLSRESVVAAGMLIMRAEGLERLTMRRLATELDTGPASLYVYVDNMAELHGALLDELLRDVPLPPISADGWRDAVIAVLFDYTRMLWSYPSLARSVLALHPSGPHYLRLIDCLLGLLAAGGVPPRAAAWGVDPLLQLATATAAEQGTRHESPEAAGEQQHLALAVREARSADYPHIAHARDDLFSGTGEQRLRWYFGLLLTGMTATPFPDGAVNADSEPGDRGQ
jgi:AcrR family transcriptional regulator